MEPAGGCWPGERVPRLRGRDDFGMGIEGTTGPQDCRTTGPTEDLKTMGTNDEC